MASRPADIQFDGIKELRALLKELPNRVRKTHLRRAVSAGGTPILRAAKRRVPTRSKLLKRSLAKKVKTYPSSGNVVAIIGANRAISGVYRGRRRVPANYIHLVEQGHAGPRPAPAKPFLRPAFEESKGQAVAIMAQKFKVGVEAEALKLGKR